MIRVNSNSSVIFLIISLSLILSACSETPTTPISTAYEPVITTSEEDSPSRYHHKHHLKTAKAYKNTVWERLLSLYSLPDVDNIRIERELNWYRDHPAYLARVQQRAEPYLHFILDEIEAKNIPGELALLPIVESAFIPDAYSKADASGLWQFIPATGRLYGLKQNEWYDGRRDIYASTKAATSFLKHLGETFNGDWFLALASYNCGKGNIWKSQARNENRNMPTDYWSLDLPKETEDYVPRLLAIAKLIANAEEYNIPLQRIPDAPYLEVVDIGSPVDLQKAAELADMPLSKFLKLNPGFNRLCTAPKGPHRLLVPVTKAEQFKTSLAQLPFEDRVNFKQFFDNDANEEETVAKAEEQKPVQTIHSFENPSNSEHYTVKSGESLSIIASRNNTTLLAIRQANHLKGNFARSGFVLQIPVAKKEQETRTLASASKYAHTHDAKTTSKTSSHNVYKPASKWMKVPAKPVLVAEHKPGYKSVNHQLAATSGKHSVAKSPAKHGSVSQLSKKQYIPASTANKTSTASKKAQRTNGKLKVVLNSHHSI